MARTTTNIINSVTVNPGYLYGAHATKVDMSSSTSANIAIEISITNGATPPGLNEHIKFYYTFSNINITTASDAPTQLKVSGYYDVLLPRTASAVSVFEIPSVPFAGNYIYMWLETIKLTSAVTVKVDAINL